MDDDPSTTEAGGTSIFHNLAVGPRRTLRIGLHVREVTDTLTGRVVERTFAVANMKPRSKNPKIPAISQAIGWLAGYAADNQKDDRLYAVIVWSVMRWPDDNPDEVVGQVFNGQYITEADAMGDEEGVGSFIGYFTDDEEGRKNFRKAADLWREAGGSEAEDDESEDEDDEDDEDDEEWEEDEDEEEDEEEEEEDDGLEF